MGLDIPTDEWKKLTHKERRRLIAKERKRRKRTAAALVREEEERAEEMMDTQSGGFSDREREREEAERQLQHEAWVQREKIAQEEFRKKRDKEEKKMREREERERLIREEWEAMERREKEAEERREKAKMDKEAMLQQALSTIDNVMEESGMELWHNPLAPTSVTTPTVPTAHTQDPTNIGTEKDVVNCPFYLKVGACRFGDRCSRRHEVPLSSSTLLIRGMFSHMSLTGQLSLDEHDQDSSLEVDDREVYQHFVDFYNDVLPEFQKIGKIHQFKVSCNHEPHLRGNVYVQFSSEEECGEAVRLFNGRWYAGRQLSCEFCPVLKWRQAICGLYEWNRCPKGKHCNFLHVFRNPGGAFSWADRDSPAPQTHADTREHRTRRRWSASSHEVLHTHDHSSRYQERQRRSHSRSPSERQRRHYSYSSDSSPEHRWESSSRRRHRHRRRDKEHSPDRDSRRHRSSHSKKRKRRRSNSLSDEDERTEKHRKHKKQHHHHHNHKHRHKHRHSSPKIEEENTNEGDRGTACNGQDKTACNGRDETACNGRDETACNGRDEAACNGWDETMKSSVAQDEEEVEDKSRCEVIVV